MALPKFKIGDKIRRIGYAEEWEIIYFRISMDEYDLMSMITRNVFQVPGSTVEHDYELVPDCPVVHANTHYTPGTFGHMRASAIIKADMAMQQGNLIKPKGPKFKAGDKIRSLHYPEVIREVLLVLPNQYIINPHIQGQDKQGYVDAEHLEFLYEKCGIPEEIPLVPDYCNHDWHEYIGIYNHYYYCKSCNQRKPSERP